MVIQNTQLVFSASLFECEPGVHRNKKIIWVKFRKDLEIIKLLKETAKSHFSWSQKCWYVADNAFNRNLFGITVEGVGKEALQKISEINLPAMKQFQEQIVLKGFSPSTLKTYSIEFAQLL